MDRSAFRHDLVALLKEYELFLHKLAWNEDPVKGLLGVTVQAGGELDDQTSFDFREPAPPDPE